MRFIAGYIDARGAAPSFLECKEALGLCSKSGIHRLVDGLVERGLLHRSPNRARAFELTAPVAVPRAPDGAALFSVPFHGDRYAGR